MLAKKPLQTLVSIRRVVAAHASAPPPGNQNPPSLRWLLHSALATCLVLLVVLVLRMTPGSLGVHVVMLVSMIAVLAFGATELGKSVLKINSPDATETENVYIASGRIATLILVLIAATFSTVQIINALTHPVRQKLDELDKETSHRDRTVRELIAHSYFEGSYRDRQRSADPTRPVRLGYSVLRTKASEEIGNIRRTLDQLESIRSDPTVSEASARIRPRLLYDLAMCNYLIGKNASIYAITDAFPADDYTLWVQAMFLRGRALIDDGRFDEAIAHFTSLQTQVGDERALLTLFARAHLQKTIAKGARILPDGHPERLSKENRLDIETAMNLLERALIAPSRLGGVVAPLDQFAPITFLAVARGLHRDPLDQVRAYRPDYQHAIHVIDLALAHGLDGELCNVYISARVQLACTSIELFRETMTDEEFATLLQATNYAGPKAAKAESGEMLMGTIENLVEHLDEKATTSQVTKARERAESVLDKYGMFLDTAQAFRCYTVLSRIAGKECLYALRDNVRTLKPNERLTDARVAEILAKEDRLDRALHKCEEIRCDHDYYLLRGQKGQRLIFLAGVMTGPRSVETWNEGKSLLQDAVNHLDGTPEAKAAPSALKPVVDRLRTFLASLKTPPKF